MYNVAWRLILTGSCYQLPCAQGSCRDLKQDPFMFILYGYPKYLGKSLESMPYQDPYKILRQDPGKSSVILSGSCKDSHQLGVCYFSNSATVFKLKKEHTVFSDNDLHALVKLTPPPCSGSKLIAVTLCPSFSLQPSSIIYQVSISFIWRK